MLPDAHLLCYHYRFISKEFMATKVKWKHYGSAVYKNMNGCTVEDMLQVDYADVLDETLKKKSITGETTISGEIPTVPQTKNGKTKSSRRTAGEHEL